MTLLHRLPAPSLPLPCLFIAVLLSVTVKAGEFETLSEQGRRNYATPEGRRYMDRFDNAILPTFSKALHKCSLRTSDTRKPAELVLVIAADGTVKRILASPGIPFGL